ncbi:hypothetical protein LSAT2_004405 [Lamellibrachia satsuma]|nr:hypothetical protein LSAT2_004405 [Lamellibrachia satsuma]
MVFSWQLLALSALVLLLCPAPAWPCRRRNGGTKTFNHDVKTQSGLTALYNQRVVKATRWKRPLASFSFGGFIKHEGVVVLLADGRQYLIHKVMMARPINR